MKELFWNVIKTCFSDLPYVTAMVCFAAWAILLRRQYSSIASYVLAMISWYFLVIGAAAMIIFDVVMFATSEPGWAKIGVVVVTAGTVPLILAGAAALFLFPRKCI